MEDVKFSEIVKSSEWDGKLYSTYNREGKMISSEILVPFKFWNNNGKPLKLEDFTVDGKIDNSKLSKELLEAFGYRIPTSGVNLMSNIKIVGFLPENYGDLVIAPADFIAQMGSDFDVDKLYTHMYNTWYNEEEGTIERLTSLHINKKNFESESIQNKLLDIHRAILNNPAIEVQSARMKPLSFGDLPQLAKDLYVSTISDTPSVISNNYQQFKYMSARAGKSAVGIFSLNTVFNAVMQHVEAPMHFFTIENKVQEIVSYVISGQTSNALNSIHTTDKTRFKSYVHEAFMAAALDNEKEQLLHKLNINNDTFDAIRAMIQLGYTEDIIVTLINQPSIKYFIETGDSSIASWKDSDKTQIALVDVKEWQSYIGTKENASELQKASLGLFLDLSEKGKELKTLQSVINADSSGIGQNLFYSMRKAEQLISLPNLTKVTNASDLVGDYVNSSDITLEQEVSLKKKGFIKYQDVLINPSTIGGFAGVYGTIFNTKLWSSLYPYSSQSFYDITSSVLENKQNRRTDINGEAKELQDISVNYKSFMISNSHNILSNYTSIDEARRQLLYNSKSNLSLGSIIAEMRSQNLYNNPFLSRLQIGATTQTIDITGNIPVDIKYLNAGIIEMDEEIVINSIIDMIVSDKIIGEFNGETLTTKDLIDKLITHQLITGGIQKSSQFIKLIPYKYLQQVSYYNNLINTNLSNEYSLNSNKIKSLYRTQYIQHNPEQYYDKTIQDEVKRIDKGVLIFKDTVPKRDLIILRDKGKDNFSIFKFNTDTNSFNQIDRLGYKGSLEYDMNVTLAGKSSMPINKAKFSFNSVNVISEDSTSELSPNTELSTEYIPSIEETKTFLSIKPNIKSSSEPLYNDVDSLPLIKKYELDSNSLPIIDKYKVIIDEIIRSNTNPITVHFAEQVKQVLPVLSNVPLSIDNNILAKGVVNSLNNKALQIRINPSKIKSEEEMQNVLMEEIIHAVLKTELSKKDSTFVSNIESLREQLVQDQTSTDNGKKDWKVMLDKLEQKKPLTKAELDNLYPLYNIDEFVAHAIKSKIFQERLNSTEATFINKSLWTKFIEAVSGLLQKLGVIKDSNLHAVLDNTLALFKDIDTSLVRDLNKPTYIRTIDYTNEKFNLLNQNSSLSIKGNPKEIADFINTHIVNLNAEVVGQSVKVSSNTLLNFNEDLAPLFSEPIAIDQSFISYIDALNQRIKQINSNINKSIENKDFSKVSQLKRDLTKEYERLDEAKRMSSVALLADKGRQDLQMIEEMLSTSMTGEDILYARGIINFWSKAKENIFQAKHKTSQTLSALYGEIESLADDKGDKLLLIEKRFVERFVKNTVGIDANIDTIMTMFGKDINFAQTYGRDISQYDNILLSSIWASLKQANIDAKREGMIILEDIETDLKTVTPILTAINKDNPWDIFMQETPTGLKTNKVVTAFTSSFYKDRARIIRELIKDNTNINYNKVANWSKNNLVYTDLIKVFPLDGIISPEVELYRNDLKLKVGEGIYNEWFNNQNKKLKNYNNFKQGEIEMLLTKYNLSVPADINTNNEAKAEYDKFVKLNSPMYFESVAFKGAKPNIGFSGYNNLKYYEMIPSNADYLDSKFSFISSNPDLLAFYNKFNKVMRDLEFFVPEDQKKNIQYGGLPSIEKTFIEMWNDTKGIQAGAEGVWDTFISSMQTSFTGGSNSVIDLSTGKPEQRLYINIIKDNSKEISDYIKFQTAKYMKDNSSYPSVDTLRIFEEEIIDQIASRNSTDLGKIIKVFSALVLSYKHKSKIENNIKVATNVLDSYREQETKPDGTPRTIKGRKLYKNADKSYINTKKSVEAFVKNTLYGDIKEEEGVGKGLKTILTSKQKDKKAELEDLLVDLETKFNNNEISIEEYDPLRLNLERQLADLEIAFVASKAGDNVLKYLQLKMLGWNVLGALSNISIGYLANMTEAAGAQFFNTKDMLYAYKLTGHSFIKNTSFNKIESDTAKKIRNMMNNLDVLKDSTYELYSASVPSTVTNKLKFLSPYNMTQRAEYLNQAPILIALARATKINTSKGEINLWDGFNVDGEWNSSEYGEKPIDDINKLMIKIDKVIARVHGNYDPLSPVMVKRQILGRAAVQFRTFLLEGIATRFETQKYDPNLEGWVKGRYRSLGTAYSASSIPDLALETLKGLLKQATFGLAFKSQDFTKFINTSERLNNIIDNLPKSNLTADIKAILDNDSLSQVEKDKNIAEVLLNAPTEETDTVTEILGSFKEGYNTIDAINMRKVCSEVVMFLEVMTMILLLSAFGKDDDDDDEVYNITMNLLHRTKTDLSFYANPDEARNIVSDIIPAMSIIKNAGGLGVAVMKLVMGEDTIETGVHVGDSRVIRQVAKNIPLLSKLESTYNAGQQDYSK